jgi:hypothetical protein
MRRVIVTALSLAALAACNEPRNYPGGPDTGLAAARTKAQKDSLILLKDSLLAVKDRQLSVQGTLIGDAATSARLVAEIDKALSDARIRVSPDTTQPESAIQNVSTDLAMVQKKVNVVLQRLRASEARVRRMRQDSTKHAALDATQIAEYERSITALRESVQQQQQEIAILTLRVDSLGRENVVLAATRDSVIRVADALAAQEDSVFVAIGTERELAAKGVVRREGGTLLMFGRGKTLVPGRAPEPGAFTAISKTRDLTIALPHTDRDYRVVSRQSLMYADVAKPQDAIVRGELRIKDPIGFWAPSKYLILVQR